MTTTIHLFLKIKEIGCFIPEFRPNNKLVMSLKAMKLSTVQWCPRKLNQFPQNCGKTFQKFSSCFIFSTENESWSSAINQVSIIVYRKFPISSQVDIAQVRALGVRCAPLTLPNPPADGGEWVDCPTANWEIIMDRKGVEDFVSKRWSKAKAAKGVKTSFARFCALQLTLLWQVNENGGNIAISFHNSSFPATVIQLFSLEHFSSHWSVTEELLAVQDPTFDKWMKNIVVFIHLGNDHK